MRSQFTTGCWLSTVEWAACVTTRYLSPLWHGRDNTMPMRMPPISSIWLQPTSWASCATTHLSMETSGPVLLSALFLELNGHLFTAREEDATEAVLALAAGTLDEGGFSLWLRANSKPDTIQD